MSALLGDSAASSSKKSNPDAILQQLTSQIENITNKCLTETEQEGKMPYLEAKIQLLLNYITNLGTYALLKVSESAKEDEESSDISNHRVFEELYRLRIILNKLPSIDAKLKYSIEKLANSVLF